MGDFSNGLKHGNGRWKKNEAPTSNQYEGQYYQDKKHGYGVFKWQSGNLYRGNYFDDERQGYGEMFWTDCSIYKGEWVRGIQHGFGTMVFPDGTVREGQFENNVFMGRSPLRKKKKVEKIEEDPEGEMNATIVGE